MGTRRLSRELAIKVLFYLEFSDDNPGIAFDLISDNFEASDEIKPFSRESVLGVCSHIEAIDDLISKTSKNWKIKRIAKIELSILRLAVYELLYNEDIPSKVSMNEAIEIAKEFGDDNSGSFVNGILDKIFITVQPKHEEKV